MATARVEYGEVAGRPPQSASSVHGACEGELSVSFTGTPGTTAAAIPATSKTRPARPILYARILVDADGYFARGLTPDATATARSAATTSRQKVYANQPFTTVCEPGDKFAFITG